MPLSRGAVLTATQIRRRRILFAPIITRVHGRHSWGGCHVSQTIPETGRKSVYYNPEDEEVLRGRRREEE